MPIAVLPRISAFVFIASDLLFSHQESTNPPGAQQTNQPAQQQPTNSSLTPPETQKPEQQPTTPEQGREPAQTPAPKPLQTPTAQAWQILHTACSADKTIARVTAVGVLGLLPGNPQARKMAEKALTDEKSEVRSSAAVALGAMQSKASIAKLREAADDQDPSVAIAAAPCTLPAIMPSMVVSVAASGGTPVIRVYSRVAAARDAASACASRGASDEITARAHNAPAAEARASRAPSSLICVFVSIALVYSQHNCDARELNYTVAQGTS